MQNNSPWFTLPSSALNNETHRSNYFCNYNEQWNRPSGNYDVPSYPNQQSMNSMRTCGETFGAANNHQNTLHQSNYECSQMFFRQNTTDYEAVSNARSRNDKARNGSANVAITAENPMSTFDKLRMTKPTAKPNDPEVENFCTVFTKSLTSLYSQDVDGNFGEERNGTTVPCAKVKTEETTNNCNNEYGYGAVFEQEGQNSAIQNFENVKVKTEPYSQDNRSQYDGYSLDDMYLKRRRGTLVEAYSRKRKHSVPASAFGNTMSTTPNEDKTPRLFQSDSQWIPNSVGTCEEPSSTTYQRTDFTENYSSFEGPRFNKRHPMKSRTTRGRNENVDVKTLSVCKKIPKKVSPLTVYVKVVDDRILDVTCRRYKKRSRPKGDIDETEEVVGSQGQSINHVMYANKSWKDLYDMVGSVLRDLVDKVANTVDSPGPSTVDLANLNPYKAKELLYKFCHNYSLDYRDFTNAEEIINSDMTSNKDDMLNRKRKQDRVPTLSPEEPRKRKRGRSTDKEESVERKPEKVVEKEPTDNKSDNAKAKPPVEPKEKPKPKAKAARNTKQQECESPQPRVLRSLPSRQPRPAPRKTRSSKKFLMKNRYPKRNLRSKKSNNVKLGKKLKILIDLSKENDQTEVLEVESDSSSHANSNLSVAKVHSKSDSETENPKPSKNVTSVGSTDETKIESEEKSTGVPSNNAIAADDDKPVTPAPCKPVTSFPCKPATSLPSKSVASLACKTLASVVCTKVNVEITENSNDDDDDNEEEEEDFGLRQPPQLVRMTDDSNMFHEHNEEKDAATGKRKSSGEPPVNGHEVNEMTATSDNAPPPTLQPNENFAAQRQFMEPPAVIEKQPRQIEEIVNHQNTILNNGLFMQKKDDPKPENAPYLPSMNISNRPKTNDVHPSESNSEDDCIVVDHEEINRPFKAKTEAKYSNMTENTSLLKEQLLEKSILEKISRSSVIDRKSFSLSPNIKNIVKDEHDESILRALLLETEAVSNSGIMKEFESSGASSPIIANIINSSSRDALSALGIEAMKAQDFMGSSWLPMPGENLEDSGEPLHFMSLQSLFNDSHLFPELYEDAQQAQSNSPTSVSANGDIADTLTNDPEELNKRIEILKYEIRFFQRLANQKERERVALTCFRRYKEEVLKRIYKLYACSVQDHVRDWIYAKRENAAETRPDNGSATKPQKPPSPHKRSDNSSAISESSRTNISNSYRDVAYPLPSPAHSSSMNHRSQSLHVPQKTATPRGPNSVNGTNEKVSTVETMVAKATENYGLDMTNLRDRLRCSPETSVPGNILMKVLSSQSSSHSSTPENPYGPRSWSPDRGSKSRNTPAVAKAGPPVLPKVYQDQYNIPLDMMMNQTSRLSPNVDSNRTVKAIDNYRNSPETGRPTKCSPEKSQIQTLLAEPVQIKTHCNPYRSWSIQAGGRIDERASSYNKSVSTVGPPVSIPPVPTGPPVVESPLQRQLNSSNGLPMQNYGMPSPSMKPSYNVNNHRPGLPGKMERTNGNVDCIRNKKIEEDRRQMNYGPNVPSMSASSTMPYGGHIIRNSSPMATGVSANKVGTASSSSNPLCMGCGVTHAKFLCSGCRKHWYCSPHCQSMRWPEHAGVCAGRMFPQTPRAYS